jgi:hypothetical protein
MTANQLAFGRNHTTADSISITHFGGLDECWRVDIKWHDGAWVYMIHNTKADALAHVHRLGWA